MITSNNYLFQQGKTKHHEVSSKIKYPSYFQFKKPLRNILFTFEKGKNRKEGHDQNWLHVKMIVSLIKCNHYKERPKISELYAKVFKN